MPRPLIGRVGRSAGAAEHRVTQHRFALALSRTTSFTRATALGCVVALALAGAPAAAAAQTSSGSLASIRAAVDATAARWFAAQRHSVELDLEIRTLEKTLAAAQERIAGIREIANERAIQIYENSAQGLDTIVGKNPLELGRRAALIGQANSDGQHAIDELIASVADLTARSHRLRAARADEARTVKSLTTQRQALDAELASLQLRSAHATSHTVLAADVGRARTALAVDATLPAPTSSTTTAPQASAGAPTTVTPPPDTGAVSRHHNNPFLVCTRARESDGDYGAISPSGYYGAYQFAPTTWNVSASHIGRLDLVGVLPSAASEFDQDEMAWALYRWQGNAPWGGRC